MQGFWHFAFEPNLTIDCPTIHFPILLLLSYPSSSFLSQKTPHPITITEGKGISNYDIKLANAVDSNAIFDSPTWCMMG
jgi:hypothetical protein